MESNNADHMREPLPVTQLPGITETLKDFAPNQANQPLITISERPALVANDVPMSFSSDLGLSNGDSQESKPSNGDPAGILNIYTRRADQIGPSHYIRGIGHLQDILPPPGWKQGDDPINEAEAKRFFVESRARAKDMLDQSTSETSHFSSADQERLTEENRKYQSQRALDEFLLLERVKLYHFWRDRKQKQSQQTRSQPQQTPQFELTPTTRPQPIQPPAETSMMAYQRHQQSLVPASPHLYVPSPPLSGGTLNARINYMMQGKIDLPLDRESVS